jgi:hypothetical protein
LAKDFNALLDINGAFSDRGGTKAEDGDLLVRSTENSFLQFVDRLSGRLPVNSGKGQSGTGTAGPFQSRLCSKEHIFCE